MKLSVTKLIPLLTGVTLLTSACGGGSGAAGGPAALADPCANLAALTYFPQSTQSAGFGFNPVGGLGGFPQQTAGVPTQPGSVNAQFCPNANTQAGPQVLTGVWKSPRQRDPSGYTDFEITLQISAVAGLGQQPYIQVKKEFFPILKFFRPVPLITDLAPIATITGNTVTMNGSKERKIENVDFPSDDQRSILKYTYLVGTPASFTYSLPNAANRNQLVITGAFPGGPQGALTYSKQ